MPRLDSADPRQGQEPAIIMTATLDSTNSFDAQKRSMSVRTSKRRSSPIASLQKTLIEIGQHSQLYSVKH